MAWYWLGLILFFVGVIEYLIDEYQQLLAVRLKISQTMLFAVLNRFMDLVVDIFAFAILMKFYEQIKMGNYAIDILFPYLLYLLGCVIGTGCALFIYKKTKRKIDQKRRLQHLEKARSIKKQLQTLEEDLSVEMEVETESEFDDDTQNKESIKDATGKEIRTETESDRKSTKEEKHRKNSPQ